MALQYKLILKDGKVQIELLGCTGPACDANAEKIRQQLGLLAPAHAEYKPEYGQAAETEAVVSADVQ